MDSSLSTTCLASTAPWFRDTVFAIRFGRTSFQVSITIFSLYISFCFNLCFISRCPYQHYAARGVRLSRPEAARDGQEGDGGQDHQLPDRWGEGLPSCGEKLPKVLASRLQSQWRISWRASKKTWIIKLIITWLSMREKSLLMNKNVAISRLFSLFIIWSVGNIYRPMNFRLGP